jgi:SAM-dependent methyltransferase
VSLHVLKEHRGYLADVVRNRAYEAALARVAPGAVVLDLGCGTGVWGLVALRHGAKKVYAVESTGMIDWARTIAGANGARDRIEHIRGTSTEIDLPEQVDVVVGDQLGAFILEGDAVVALGDAARRHLKPAGTMIPGRIDFWVALATCASVEDTMRFWSGQPLGLDFSALADMAAGSRFFLSPDPSTFAAPPVLAGSVDLRSVTGPLLRFSSSIPLDEAGTANCILGWFEAALGPEVTISNGPPAPSRIDRDCAALPVWPPITWDAGDRAQIELVARLGSDVLAWSVTAGGQRRHSSTVAGAVAGAEDVRRARAKLTQEACPTEGETRPPGPSQPAMSPDPGAQPGRSGQG